jgi:hypothetical protein
MESDGGFASAYPARRAKTHSASAARSSAHDEQNEAKLPKAITRVHLDVAAPDADGTHEVIPKAEHTNDDRLQTGKHGSHAGRHRQDVALPGRVIAR